jgi:hypothetical protein
MDAPIDLQAETYRVGELILKCLSDLGHVWEARDGTLVEVRFAGARVVAGQYALFDVDTLRLPRKVTAADLTHPRVIHHLATVCGRPVSVFNTHGITYIVNLVPAPPRPAPRLPRHVPLTWERLLAWAELEDTAGTTSGVAPGDNSGLAGAAGDEMPRVGEATQGIQAAHRPGEPRVPVGIGQQGEVWCALPVLGHTLITGATGSGKSTWAHAALAVLLLQNTPAQLQLALVDPKRSEFAVWAGVPHLVDAVAHDEATAGALLARLVAELERRSELLAGALARDLARYNRRAAEPLPYVLLVIDEVLDLLLPAGERSALGKDLTRLVVKGRAAGIFVWVASQHARFDLLPRAVNVNLGSRLVFRVADEAAARLAGCPGAQQIPRTLPGRMLARLEGEPLPVQGYHVDEAALQRVVARLREPGPATRLNAAELALVRYAIEQLDGCFIVGKLAAAFAGEWTHYRIATLARTWEARGWLSRPAHATDPRRVGEMLREYGVRSME